MPDSDDQERNTPRHVKIIPAVLDHTPDDAGSSSDDFDELPRSMVRKARCFVEAPFLKERVDNSMLLDSLVSFKGD